MTAWLAYLFWPAVYLALCLAVFALTWRTHDRHKIDLAFALLAAWMLSNLWVMTLFEAAPLFIALTDIALAVIVTRIGLNGATNAARAILLLYGARLLTQIADFWLPFPHHAYAFYACLNLAYLGQLVSLGVASAHDLAEGVDRTGGVGRFWDWRWLRHGLGGHARQKAKAPEEVNHGGA